MRWDDAACKDKAMAFMFPERGDVIGVGLAKRLCRSCPIRVACLDEALATEADGERFGVRGGLSPNQRTLLSRRQERSSLAGRA